VNKLAQTPCFEITKPDAIQPVHCKITSFSFFPFTWLRKFCGDVECENCSVFFTAAYMLAKFRSCEEERLVFFSKRPSSLIGVLLCKWCLLWVICVWIVPCSGIDSTQCGSCTFSGLKLSCTVISRPFFVSSRKSKRKMWLVRWGLIQVHFLKIGRFSID